jgi:hypothetical protein
MKNKHFNPENPNIQICYSWWNDEETPNAYNYSIGISYFTEQRSCITISLLS